MARFVISGIWKDKAIKDAVNSLKGLTKQTQQFSRLTAAAYASAGAAAAYYAKRLAKESVNAALADEKSQRQLAFTLREVAAANEGAAIAAEANIQQMSRMYGIADDQLRPALSTLLRSTRSTTQAFQGLDLALSLSTATGSDLESVTRALSRAYAGNFKGLKSLNLGIDEQKIKNKDLEGIIRDLRKEYGDFAKNELNTATNQFNKLKVASDEAKESIGTAMIEAIMAIINSLGGVDKVVKRIEGIGIAIADTIRGVQVLVQAFKNFFANLNAQAKTLGTLGTVFLLAYKFGKLLTKLTPWRLMAGAIGYVVKVSKDLGKQQRINAAIAAANSRQVVSARNAEYLATKKLKEEEKGKGALAEKTLEQLMAEEAARRAGFKITEDIDSIQTVAAAKRLEESRQYKMSLIDAAQAGYDAFKKTYDQLQTTLQSQIDKFNELKTRLEQGIVIPVSVTGQFGGAGMIAAQAAQMVPAPSPSSVNNFIAPDLTTRNAIMGQAPVNVTVNAGAVGSEQFLADLITRSITQANRSGISTTPAGALG
jgi:hypothetical protein